MNGRTVESAFSFFFFPGSAPAFFDALEKPLTDAVASPSPLVLDSFAFFLVGGLNCGEIVLFFIRDLCKNRRALEGQRIHANIVQRVSVGAGCQLYRRAMQRRYVFCEMATSNKPYERDNEC
jgi:hypothetical protein